jgi:[ribosomal protein S18]-alanine N-acetyltransferase
MSLEPVLDDMRAEDLDEVMAIEVCAFPSPWTKGMFIEELRQDRAINLVVRRGGVMLAYINFWVVLDEVHLLHIAVHRSCRMQGIGTILMEGMMERARLQGATRVTLEVRQFNEGAIKFYEGFSFVVTGVRPRYYDDTGEDALIMWAPVPEKKDHGHTRLSYDRGHRR